MLARLSSASAGRTLWRLGVVALPVLALGQARADDDPVQPPAVIVSAQRQAVIRKIDRTVYDVSNSVSAANGTAQDVLQATPEVSVAADGRLAVKGNGEVTVLINGKPSAVLSGSSEERAAVLQTMSGADIARVEVISNPSAAHQAGRGAVIDIVLKEGVQRSAKQGAHAQWRGSRGHKGRWQSAVSAGVDGPRVSVRANVALRRDSSRKIRQSILDWRDVRTGFDRQIQQSSSVLVRRASHSAGVGADIAVSETDSVSLSARHSARRSHPLLDVLYRERDGAADSVYHRISEGPNAQAERSVSAAYHHRSGARVVSATLQRSVTEVLTDKLYRDLYVTPQRDTVYGRSVNRSLRRLQQATFDISHPGQYGLLSLGFDVQHQHDSAGACQAQLDRFGGAETPDLAISHGFAATTRRQAVYLTDQLRDGAWEALLGMRAERTVVSLKSGQDGVVTPAGHGWAWNPSLHLRHALDDKEDLTFSYRRSTQAPDARDLNPQRIYLDANNLASGNSALQPQRFKVIEIGASREGARLSGSTGAFYRSGKDLVFASRTLLDDVLLTSKHNGGRSRSVGMNATLDWKISGALTAGVDGGVYRALFSSLEMESDTSAANTGRLLARRHAVSGYLKLRAALKAGASDVSLDADVQSSGVDGLGRYGATSSVNLGWKYRYSKTLSLTFNANDLFDGGRRSYSSQTGGLRQRGFDHFVGRSVYVGVITGIE